MSQWTIDDQDVAVAARRVAELFKGPDDGTKERNALEEQIQKVMEESFKKTVKLGGRDLLKVFKSMATCIFDAAEEDDDGNLSVLEEGAYGWAGHYEFELAVRLGPEFVRSLNEFGFQEAIEQYESGQFRLGQDFMCEESSED
jgi:hypothetical protein